MPDCSRELIVHRTSGRTTEYDFDDEAVVIDLIAGEVRYHGEIESRCCFFEVEMRDSDLRVFGRFPDWPDRDPSNVAELVRGELIELADRLSKDDGVIVRENHP